MNVIAWNLAHQIREKPIPDYLVEVIQDLDANTVLFNEYVDADSREPFKAAMRDAGYEYQAVSPTPARPDQIFAASRHRFEVGDLKPEFPRHTGNGSRIDHVIHTPSVKIEAVEYIAGFADATSLA